jgi:hypothetical protein
MYDDRQVDGDTASDGNTASDGTGPAAVGDREDSENE